MIADCGLRIADSNGAGQSAIVWHLVLEPKGRSGPDNMALDEALLLEADRTGAAFLRLYRWNPPCLSFGWNEPAAARYDRAAIERRGLAVVRRPTGGRAVWHEHDVTYAVAAPVAAFGSLRQSYGAIHTRLAVALRSLGADVQLADRPTLRPSGRLEGACFASAAGGEILAGGRKVVGSAQVRRGSAFLQHGSILLDGSQDVVREVSKELGAGSQETTLREVLGRPVGFEEVCAAIIETWGEPLIRSARPPVRPSGRNETWRR